MCLTTRMKNCLVADKPIRCYKVVEKKAEDHFTSILRKFKYNLGKTYKLRCSSDFPEKNKFRYLDVHEGFHSYAHARHANEDCDGVDRDNVPDPESFIGEVMLLCEIPAGARYWTGNRSSKDKDYAEYCSDAIVTVAYKLPGEGNEWIDVSGESI